VGEDRSFYQRLEETGVGGTTMLGHYRATGHTIGPWDDRHQHAGPPTSLLVRAIERLGHGPSRPLVTRATAEILAPVPVTDVHVRARVERPGRNVAWCTAELSAGAASDPVMRMQAWVMRRAPAALDVPDTPVQPAPAAGTPTPRPPSWNPGYLDAVAWRVVEGGFAEPGPAVVWTRLTVTVVDGEEPSGMQRLASVADSGSGISAVAHPAALFFLNTDLTIHVHREPAGADIWMAAATTVDRAGVGLARTTVGDTAGSFGAAAQSLFVAPR
jgi:hypothetical protein